LGRGGSTAVTAILIDGQKLVVANIGDSRAVLSKKGVAKQLSVDHEPTTEHEDIKNRGGFVSRFPGRLHFIMFIILLHLIRIWHSVVQLRQFSLSKLMNFIAFLI